MHRELKFTADRGQHLDLDDLAKAVEQAREIGFSGGVQPKVQLVNDRATGWIRSVSFGGWA